MMNQIASSGVKRRAASVRWKPLPAGVASHTEDQHDTSSWSPGNCSQDTSPHMTGCWLNSCWSSSFWEVHWHHRGRHVVGKESMLRPLCSVYTSQSHCACPQWHCGGQSDFSTHTLLSLIHCEGFHGVLRQGMKSSTQPQVVRRWGSSNGDR